MGRVILLAFLILGTVSYSQDNVALREIVNSSGENTIKQKKIDSFLLVNAQKFSLEELADCYHDLGLKWYYKNWRATASESSLLSAIKATKRALDMKREVDSLKNCSLNKTLYNLGFFYSRNNQIYKDIECQLELIEKGKFYCKPNDDGENDNILFARQHLAGLYNQLGDFYKAIDIATNQIDAIKSEKNFDKHQLTRLLDTHILLANIYASMGYVQFSKPIELNIFKADSLVKNTEVGNTHTIAQINQIEGNRYQELGNYEKAIDHHELVLKNLDRDDSTNLAKCYNSLAISYLKLNKSEEAFKTLNTAITYRHSYADPYNNFGDLYTEKGDFSKAMTNYQNAINHSIDKSADFTYDQRINIDDLELSTEKISLLNHLVTKANAWIRYYNHQNNKDHLEHALHEFSLADKLVDLIRLESNEFQSKLFWREKGSSLYSKAIKVCFLLDKPQMAYHFMERNKALLLLEDLNNEEAKELAGLTKEAKEKEYSLRQAINLSENALQEKLTGTNEQVIVRLKDIVRKNKYHYEKFIDSLENTYPDYAKFKKKVDVLTFENLMANYISENKATLHYILNEEDGYGLLTTADTTALFRLDDIPNLNKEVENLITALSNGVSDISDFKGISNTVFQKLFPKNVYDKIKKKQLTIIPDYTLQQIPFETLVVDSNELTYLFQDVEIGYAYSVSLLDHNQKDHKDFNANLLGIAPIAFDSLKLPELYFSENEIKNIAQVYPGATLLNGRASKANFIENANNHSILHLATHADIGDGDNPWIAFTNSKMYLKEIYATKNKADMVVLSACNTSSGELKRGEGVMSLARGFFYSGAKSVVSTLWPVADESGKDILINFYKNLAQADSKSKALQKAKLDYLKNIEEEELKHPYYWAGFVVLGDNSPISDKPFSPWVIAGLGLLGTGILVFGYKKIKARQAAA